MTLRKIALSSLSILVCCITAGCGGPGPFDYGPVSGTLAYEDGTPGPTGGIKLKFIALDAPLVNGAKARPAIAHLDNHGQFELVTSYKYGDGLVQGRHKVAILDAKDKEGKLLIPKEYSSLSKTPLTIDTETLPLDIKVPKP